MIKSLPFEVLDHKVSIQVEPDTIHKEIALLTDELVFVDVDHHKGVLEFHGNGKWLVVEFILHFLEAALGLLGHPVVEEDLPVFEHDAMLLGAGQTLDPGRAIDLDGAVAAHPWVDQHLEADHETVLVVGVPDGNVVYAVAGVAEVTAV